MMNNGKNPIDSSMPINSDEEDVESHGMDDTTGYTSNTDIQDALDQTNHSLSISLDGTNWFTPIVEEVVKPIIGSVYSSLDVAKSVYQKYAETAGFERDCDNFVGHGDAKVLVDLMTKKRDANHNFFFEYNCVGSELHTIFWVDEVARFNYSEFGDVISFDATFRTN
ncbi:hypothetical protein Ccrd_008719, partial [Cynara cardunculus var. scolymus]